jgi:lipopolysaccharide export system permease protein
MSQRLIASPRVFRGTLFAWRFPVYLLREFVPLFFIFMPVLLVMMTIDFVASVAGLVIANQASFGLFLQSWAQRFPYMVSYITPPSLAITILIGLGRLAKDSELKAAYSAGVQPLRLVWPIMAFALPVAVGMFLNTNYLQPIADAGVLDTFAKIRGQPGAPKTQQIVSFASSDGKILFQAGSLTPRDNDPFLADLRGVIIVTPDGTWTALEGFWDARAKTWTLNDSSYSGAPLDPQASGSTNPGLTSFTFGVQVASKVTSTVTSNGVVSPPGDVRAVGSGVSSSSPVSSITPGFSTSGPSAARQVDQRVFPFESALGPDSRPPEHLALPDLLARTRLASLDVKARYDANYKLQSRFADPFACLVFALVATSVGLTVANRGSAFAAVIVFIAGYFMIWTLGKGMAGSQAVPAWIAAWLPVLVFGTGSVLSLRRLI